MPYCIIRTNISHAIFNEEIHKDFEQLMNGHLHYKTAVELHAGLRVIFDNSQEAFICVHVYSTLFKKDAEKTSRTVALVTDFLLEKIGGLHRDRVLVLTEQIDWEMGGARGEVFTTLMPKVCDHPDKDCRD